MDEFSMECEDWENENGEFKKGKFMIESNTRTKDARFFRYIPFST